MNSTITLTFVNIPTLDEYISIGVNLGVPVYNRETFKTLRIYSGQTTIGGSTTTQAQNYTTAWNLDFRNAGGTDNLVATWNLDNTVTITLLDKAWQFIAPIGDSVTGGDITYVINNVPVESPKVATFVDFTTYGSDVCNFVYANYTVTGGNGSYNVWVNGVQQLTAQASPIAVLIPRDVTSTISFYDTVGTLIKTVYKAPPTKILASGITATITNLSSGTSINITVEGSIYNAPLEYSLTNDGLDWQVSNVFSGLAPGNYTVYVKDVFGCVTASNTIVIDGVTEVAETVMTISEINALRFALLETGVKKNHKNTLSCQELKQIKFKFLHRYVSGDFVTTQFKTNAQYINVFTLDVNGNSNVQTVLKQTENIGLEAKTTSTYFDLGGGRSAVYFGVVDVLNVITDVVEDTIDFGFTLPEWADSVGKIVNLEGVGDIAIAGVEYSDFYDSFIITFDTAYSGSPVERKLYSQYNLQPYEVYETVLDISAEPESFNLIIEVGSDSGNIDFTYASETIKRVTDSDRYFEIEYWHDENVGEMVYQTGITHLIRLEGMQDYVGFQEIEGYDGDEEHYNTRDVVFDSQKFWFFRLSSEMAHKLRLITGHRFLKINGLFYKISEVPEIKTSPTSNLKTFSVILKRSGEQFLTDAQEIISLSETNDSIAGAIEASQGRANILWTKTSG